MWHCNLIANPLERYLVRTTGVCHTNRSEQQGFTGPSSSEDCMLCVTLFLYSDPPLGSCPKIQLTQQRELVPIVIGGR